MLDFHGRADGLRDWRGACLACVCQSKDKDEHSNVNNKRVCKEGPVFRAEEVEL